MSKRQRKRRRGRRRQTKRTGGALAARGAAGTGLGLTAALGLSATAEAADFTVTNKDDVGLGSLRQAITNANNNNSPTVDRILFQAGLSGTITLGSQLPTIDEPLQILGPGAGTLAVGNLASRILYIDTAAGHDVTISDLTLSGASTSGPGAGIRTRDADLTIQSSTISGNSTTGAGGAVFSYQGTLTIQGSTISGNLASGGGGGVYSNQDALTIRASTISGNRASHRGGGIYSRDGAVTIESSTISGNSTSGVNTYGGGVFSYSGVLTIESSTISGNSTSADGGGVHSRADSPDPTLTNTIIANNSAAGAGPDLDSLDDTFGLAFSLVENTSGVPISQTVAGSNLLGVDPVLGALAANGGPTRTQAPAQSSPVLDQGSSALASDQRGGPRPFDLSFLANAGAAGADGSDIGAFELVLSPMCGGKRATILAPGGAISGTPGADVIVGTNGADAIRSKGGKDLVCAGKGRDRVSGGAGNDTLRGEGGKDTLRGQGGRDRLIGGPGRDRLIGGPLLDRMIGGPGRDRQRQ